MSSGNTTECPMCACAFSRTLTRWFLVLLTCIFTVSTTRAADCDHIPRGKRPKLTIGAGFDLTNDRHDPLSLKFVEGTAVRLREGAFVSMAEDLSLGRAQSHDLDGSVINREIERLNALLKRNGATAVRRFSASEAAIRDQRCRGELLTDKELPDLNLLYAVTLSGDSNTAELLTVLRQFRIVEYAMIKIPLGPPTTPGNAGDPTPDYVLDQGYFDPAPAGIDVAYARALPGGRGEGVRVVDVEQGVHILHEDLPGLTSLTGELLIEDDFAMWHGDAALGVVAARENGYGCTGIAPAAQIAMASVLKPWPDRFLDGADAIQRASVQAERGDIILIEQGVWYSASDNSFSPVEWDLDQRQAIEVAVGDGRIVIEPAANGSQNLDDAVRFGGSPFPRGLPDSGAILVGASGTPTSARTARIDSNYGSRVDVQGWGADVMTLGKGFRYVFYPGNDPLRAYTKTFAGTSSASAIVAGAAAIIQGVVRQRQLPDLDSVGMRNALKVGATPQGGSKHIGPLPNLRAAIAALPLKPPIIVASGRASGATVTWTAAPGASQYEVYRKDSIASPWTLMGGPLPATIYTDTNTIAGRSYLYAVRSVDAAGNRGAIGAPNLATMITYADENLTPGAVIRAQHLVDLRAAVNALCAFVGSPTCSTPIFDATQLSAASVAGTAVRALDLIEVTNRIIALLSDMNLPPVAITEFASANTSIRSLLVEQLRAAAN